MVGGAGGGAGHDSNACRGRSQRRDCRQARALGEAEPAARPATNGAGLLPTGVARPAKGERRGRRGVQIGLPNDPQTEALIDTRIKWVNPMSICTKKIVLDSGSMGRPGQICIPNWHAVQSSFFFFGSDIPTHPDSDPMHACTNPPLIWI